VPWMWKRAFGCPLIAAFALVPNQPAPFWYAAPEVACDLVTADRDQWQCDEEPITWQPHSVPIR
jgi:hypothetical protein